MPKKNKLSTPEWIKEGYDSKADWEKAQGKKVGKSGSGKTFKVRRCPKCNSDKVKVVVGAEGSEVGMWMCEACGWKGKDIVKEELNEEEFMAYLDDPKKSEIFGNFNSDEIEVKDAEENPGKGRGG